MCSTSNSVIIKSLDVLRDKLVRSVGLELSGTYIQIRITDSLAKISQKLAEDFPKVCEVFVVMFLCDSHKK